MKEFIKLTKQEIRILGEAVVEDMRRDYYKSNVGSKEISEYIERLQRIKDMYMLAEEDDPKDNPDEYI